MIKRFHEAPILIFEQVQNLTDGDYALVHLFKDNPVYYQRFVEALEKGREVILDNSLFELREAFDMFEFAKWVKQLKPTYFIVPDCWKNGDETVRMFFEFIKNFDCYPSKIIGVAQGNTLEEVAQTYYSIEPYCDKVAFNFDFSSYSGLPKNGIPNPLRMSVGRYKMLCDLYNKGVINEAKPHHLLGCGVPQEVLWYDKRWAWIDSIDTCNPVINGMKLRKYDESIYGLTDKLKDRMCDHINDDITPKQWQVIEHNINMMKELCLKEERICLTKELKDENKYIRQKNN